MKYITYKEAKAMFTDPLSIKTLGHASNIMVSTKDNQLHIVNSKGSEYEVTEELWETVQGRYEELCETGENHKPSAYTDKYWDDCPNWILCPYVASVIRIAFLLDPGKYA